MTIFTVHVPAGGDDPAVLADRTRFVPESFSWGAFLFGPLWFAGRGVWLGVALWLAGAALIFAIRYLLPIPPNGVVALALLGSLFLGFEANALRRRSLSRGKFRLVDVVSGHGLEAAEQTFFRRLMAPPAASSSISRPGAVPGLRPPGPVGSLFPDAGG